MLHENINIAPGSAYCRSCYGTHPKGEHFVDDSTPAPCTIDTTHCENCGSTDYEDIVANADQGYTGCCNELTAYGRSDCRGFHNE